MFILTYSIFIYNYGETKNDLSFTNIKSTWVDSMMVNMSLDEKLGQLFIIEFDSIDIYNKDSIYRLINEYKIGGIKIKKSKLIDRQVVIHNIQSKSKIPLFVSGNYESLDNNDCTLPNALQISAIKDSVIFDKYVDNLVKINKLIGTNIDFTTIIDTYNEKLHYRKKTFGDNQKEILKKLEKIVSFSNKNKILSCVSYINNHFQKNDTLSIPDTLLFAYTKIMKKVPIVMINKNLNVKEKNSNYLKSFLRKNFNFEGIIISELRNDYNEEKMQNFMFAGSEMFLINKQIADYIILLKNKINNKPELLLELNKTVKKILSAKAWLALDNTKFKSAENIISKVNTSEHNYLKRKFIESSITVIRNRHRLLPFDYTSNKKFHIVNIGNNKFQHFTEQMLYFTNTKSTNIVEANELNISKLKKYNPIILNLNNIIIDKQKDSSFIKELKKLDKRTNIVLVNYNKPENIKHFDFIETIIQMYTNHKFAQDLAAQLLFGTFKPRGQLPIFLSEKMKYGHSINIKKNNIFKYTIPEEVNMSSDSLSLIDSIANEAIKIKAAPGCQVIVVKNSKVIYHKTFGYHTYSKLQKVKKNDIYDLASVSKVAATTLAVMKLYEQDSITLSDSLKYYIDDTINSTLKNNQLQEFLVHKSGLPPHMPVLKFIRYRDSITKRFDKYYAPKPDSLFTLEVAKDFYMRSDYLDTIWDIINTTKIDSLKPYKYSDINMNVIYRVVNKKIDSPFDSFIYKNFYKPLGLKTIRFNPLKKFNKNRIVPTQKDRFWRKQLLRGYVHDESAAMYGGVSGNAGLFSSTNDLAILFQTLLNGGVYAGKRILKKETIEYFIKPQENSRRGLGFNRSSFSSFGHTGYTGICVWASQKHNLIYIFMSNRVHPRASNRKLQKNKIRERIHKVIFNSFIKLKKTPKVLVNNKKLIRNKSPLRFSLVYIKN